MWPSKIKMDEENSKMPFWHKKVVLVQHFPHDDEDAQQSLDWLDSLIGPGGLLLLVSHMFAV